MAAACDAWGGNYVGVLTLTFKEHFNGGNVDHWREAKRRFHSLRTGVLKGMFRGGVVVWEEAPDTRRLHVHIVVGCKTDIRTGFNFAAVEAKDYRSASLELRRTWATLREKCAKYKFGRPHLLPVYKRDAVKRYVAGYLGEDFDGSLCGRVRRVSYFGESVRVATMQAGWVSGAGASFRHLLQEMEAISGGGFTRWVEAVGPRWAHRVMRAWRAGVGGWKDEAGNRVELPLQAIAEHLCDVLRVPHMRPKADTGDEWGPLALTPGVKSICEAFGGVVECVEGAPCTVIPLHQ